VVFNILQPSANLIAFTNSLVAVDKEYSAIPGQTWLHWGRDYFPFTPTNYGTRFYVTNISLAGYSNACDFLFVQIGTATAKHNLTNGTSLEKFGVGLDTLYPCATVPGNYPDYFIDDYPGERVDGSAKAWRSNSFEMYLMFRPRFFDSVPVPLKKLKWAWSGLAETNGSGGWQLLSGTISLSEVNTPVHVQPSWSNNLAIRNVKTNDYWLNPLP
jgi:hypothetical protein